MIFLCSQVSHVNYTVCEVNYQVKFEIMTLDDDRYNQWRVEFLMQGYFLYK